MEHIKFADKLSELGLSFRNSGDIELEDIVISESDCKYTQEAGYRSRDAFETSMVRAIDMDKWKHSSHFEISPENYEKFQDIIQKKILKRAEDTRFLLRMYFLIQKELIKKEEK